MNSTYVILDHQFFQRLPLTEGPRPQTPSIENRLQDLRVVPYRALRWYGQSLQIIPGIGKPALPIKPRGLITSTVTSVDGSWSEDDIGDEDQPLISWCSLGADGGSEIWAKLTESSNAAVPATVTYYEGNSFVRAQEVPRSLPGSGEALLHAALEVLDAEA